MHELVGSVASAARAMWGWRWVGLIVAWAVCIAGVVALLRMPDYYEASARVFVDTKSVLKPLLRDLAVEPDIDQTVSMLARTIITRPNIEKLVARIWPGPMSPGMLEQKVDLLQREIKISGSGRDNVFSFSYRDTDSARARDVVEKLVTLFVESDLGAKARDTVSAREFIDQQIKAYETRLAEAEGRLKDFKVRNLGITDASGKDYFSRMSALTEELNKTSVELHAAEESRDALRRELTGEDFVLLPDPADQAAAAATPELDARIDAQRRQLDELLRRYTDAHPDVVAARRLIARLEEQKQQEIEARRKAAGNKVARRSANANPVFQQIKLALAEAEANVAALRVRSSDLQSRVAQLRTSAARVPQVEAELAQLNRDYDIIRRNYEALVARRETATLSGDVEATRLASFRVIDPPRSSPRPVFPNRLALSPLVLLAALGAGVAATFVACQLIPTFGSTSALRAVTQLPVLGSVSALVTPESMRRRRVQTAAFGSGVVSLVLLFGVWVAWLAKVAVV